MIPVLRQSEENEDAIEEVLAFLFGDSGIISFLVECL